MLAEIAPGANVGGAPFLDDLLEEAFVSHRALPMLREAGGCRARQAVRRQLVELDAHRQGDAVAEGERFALTEGRQELQQG